MSVSCTHDSGLAIYLVEPSDVITEALASLLEGKVRALECYTSAESLLSRQTLLAPRRCLITELHLPGMNGIELMLALKRENLMTPTIIMALEANINTAVNAIRHGAVDFVEKPCIASELFNGLSRVEDMLKTRRAQYQ